MHTRIRSYTGTPALVRKCTPFVSKIFPLSLSMVFECDADDFEPDDYTPPDQDTDAPYLVGESAIMRITEALGKTFVPQLLSNVQSLANSTAWTQRRACCVAIGTIFFLIFQHDFHSTHTHNRSDHKRRRKIRTKSLETASCCLASNVDR